jgi:serine/threonine protein kinase
MALAYEPGATLQTGRYLIRALISENPATATRVYRAEQCRQGWRQRWQEHRAVVIKVTCPEAQQPIARELAYGEAVHERLMLLHAAARHRLISRALDLFTEHGFVHLVKESVSGSTLEDLLTLDHGWAPPWPEERACTLGLQIADLLRALHAGRMHLLVRDLKPSNLMVVPSGEVTVIDLGVSCLLEAGERVPAWLCGRYSRGYAALEQRVAAGYEDERTDLYALGMILRRVATAWDPLSTVDAHFPAPAEPIAQLSPQFTAFLSALLQKVRSQRPRSAEVVYQELEVCLHSVRT